MQIKIHYTVFCVFFLATLMYVVVFTTISVLRNIVASSTIIEANFSNIKHVLFKQKKITILSR